MNPSASLTASFVILNAGSENFGNIVGDVTFQDGSANSGSVTGNASFNGSAINRQAGSISGNAVFNETSQNAGSVAGNASFADGATNPGSVAGSVDDANSRAQAAANEQAFQDWLAANSGVNQYTGEGSHAGQWAYNQGVYGSQAAAQAALEEDAFASWRAGGNSGYYGQVHGQDRWALNGDTYYSQAAFNAAQVNYNNQGYAAFQSWLAGGGHGFYNGYSMQRWAYRGQEVDSQAVYDFYVWKESHNGHYTNDGYDAWVLNGLGYYGEQNYDAAVAQAEEAAYQSWLAANSGVNQYTGAGSHNGQWAWNSTPYSSYEEAVAAQNGQ